MQRGNEAKKMVPLRQDLKRLPRLLAGLTLLAIGIYLTKLSGFGMAPWSVFHVGLVRVTGIPFGFVTQLVGLIVLVGSMVLFRTKIGLGTLLNVLLVGPIIALLETLYDTVVTQVWVAPLVFLPGLFIMTFGRSLYIASELGQGPRDGLFVGLAKTTGWPVKYVKSGVELTVFLLGVVLLWGDPTRIAQSIGIGTLLVVFLSGPLVQWYFRRLRFDPTRKENHDIRRYWRESP
jgi:uncharacterized membrane protein YczE